MKLQRLVIPLLILTLFWAAWRAWGWPGVAAVAGGVLMWLLLHFTRVMTILKRAADRPVGWVDSAVMLNARLKPGMALVQTLAITRSIGERLSDEHAQPEVYRWTDNGGSTVTTTFEGGRLVRWEMHRPPAADTESGA